MNRAYYGWLAAASLSGFGDAAVFFALGWAATGIGPGIAGLVVTAITLPRAVLLIAGGVLGDRWGPRRMVISGHVVLCLATLSLALAVHLAGTSVALLVLTGLVIGTVEAMVLPALGALPRLFVPDEQLPRALALRGSIGQVVSLVGGPASAVLVAAAGLVGALLVDAGTFAIALAVLLAVKPPYDAPARVGSSDGAPPGLASGSSRSSGSSGSSHRSYRSSYRARAVRGASVVREAEDGLRVAWSDPLLRTLLLAVALVAAFVLPVATLCVPLLARAQGRQVTDAGLIVGASVAGSLVITVVVARWGTWRRPGVVVAAGPLVAAAGMGWLAIAPTVPAAVVGTLVQGVGIGLFTSHLAPMFFAGTPRTHLTRLQSILALVQTVPLLGSMNLVGGLAGSSCRLAVLACAAGTALAGTLLLFTTSVIQASLVTESDACVLSATEPS